MSSQAVMPSLDDVVNIGAISTLNITIRKTTPKFVFEDGGGDDYEMGVTSGRYALRNTTDGRDDLSFTNAGAGGTGTTTQFTNMNAALLNGRAVGTSGSTIPLLSAVNTWSGAQTFSVAGKLMEWVNPVGGSVFTHSIDSSSVYTFGVGANTYFTVSTAAGIVFNDASVSTIDFRVESNGQTHALFVDSSADYVGIFNAAPGFALDVTGTVNVAGTTGNTTRWNAAVGAPGTTLGVTAVNRYGGDTNYLGDPTGWILVNVAGTDRKIPFYAV